jgi:hypothetical protein
VLRIKLNFEIIVAEALIGHFYAENKERIINGFTHNTMQ